MDIYWLEQTAAEVPAGDEWLSPSEARRLSALAFPKRRADWRLGRWTAKRAVREFFRDRSPAQIEIRAASTGAPEAWIDGRRQGVTISISHRQGLACCAVADRIAALGCDLETTEPHSREFISDYFTPGEQNWIARAAAAGRHEFPALLWSAKESALKALCVGLWEDTRSAAVQQDGFGSGPLSAAWRSLCVRLTGRELLGWWRADERFIRTIVADPAPQLPRERRTWNQFAGLLQEGAAP